MFLACPACESRFRVNPLAIGDGRDVRCSKCGNQWFVLQSDILDEHGFAASPPPKAESAPAVASTEFSAPPMRAQPVAKEYEANLTAPLGDEYPMEAPPMVADSTEDGSTEHDSAEHDAQMMPSGPEEKEIDIEALDRALTRKSTSLAMARPSKDSFHITMAAAACIALILFNMVAAALYFREPVIRALPVLKPLYQLAGFRETKGLSFADLKLVRYGTKERPRFDIAGAVINTTDQPITEPDIRLAMVTKDGEILREWPMNGGNKSVPKDRPLTFSTQNQFLKTSRSGEAASLVLHLGSPLELMLSDE